MGAYLIISSGGVEIMRHDLTGPTVIGRADDAQVRLVDKSISRQHCRLEPTDAGWRVVDLGSLNGVLLRGDRVSQTVLLPGDNLVMGAIEVAYMEGEVPQAEIATIVAPKLGQPDPLVAALGPRLREIFEALLTGKSRKEIAADLGLSPHTVFGYVKDVYQAVGVRSRPELMSRYARAAVHLVDDDE